MNINLLMQQAQKMQKEMAKAQKELNEKLFELDSSGGAVHLSIYGNRKIERLRSIRKRSIRKKKKCWKR